jgi:excinuclease ABC subunit A
LPTLATNLDSARVNSPSQRAIVVRGARQNNLRGIDVEFPRSRLSVITGVSGSGKSSLAFDTVYAEGQRRYVASLSTYAQQFIDRLPRPDLDSIDGLPPAIAIEQRNPTLNRRSTVGTATEVYDFLRLLYARAGVVHCPDCYRPVRGFSAAAVIEAIAVDQGSGWYVTFELPFSSVLTHDVLLDNLLQLGFVRLLIGGRELHLEALPPGTDLTRERPVFVVVDRLHGGDVAQSRWAEAIERAYEEGDGEVVLFERGETAPADARRFSRYARCGGCRRTFPEPRPALFSFNSPHGACPECNGFGFLLEYDADLIVPDPARSLADGALDPWTKPRYGSRRRRLEEFVRETDLDGGAPWAELPTDAQRALLEGGRYRGVHIEGVLQFLRRMERKKYKSYIRFFLRRYQSHRECPACCGSRLRSEASTVVVHGNCLPDLVRWPLPELAAWLDALDGSDGPMEVLEPILRELTRRVDLLQAVGLDYLTLDRLTRTLSGGEAQRIAIANAFGSALTDGVYVLDEPSVGLHARDTKKLINLLRKLTDGGNSVLVVEHDLEIVRSADRVVELGPGSGANGGAVMFQGSPVDLDRAETVTGEWLRGDASFPEPRPRPVGGPWITVRGAKAHNLQAIDVRIPIGRLTAVTGVSGSGKSTLVHDVLYRTLSPPGGPVADEAGSPMALDRIEGAERLAEVVLVDQSSIGKSPRSNPVTYVKAFDSIRALFAATPESRRRGLTAGHFSFNTSAGRCPECRGDGHQRIEMVFLPDVFVTCDGCHGQRYRPEVLEVKWRDQSIADLLAMTIDEALALFAGHPSVGRGLWVLQAVGLGYLRLGQPATTLSGGESQRLKIARELSRGPKRAGGAGGRGRSARPGRGILYLMDEPTTGLHNADIRGLMRVLNGLVTRGDTVVVVEHHLDVIARADWVIDLGPEGGPAGGRVIVAGPPREVAACDESHTGLALRAHQLAAEPVGA